VTEEEKPPTKEDFEKAKEIILNLFASQKKDTEKLLAETKNSRVDAMERSKSTISKHIGEKAFMASKQRESMTKPPAKLEDSAVKDIIEKLDKEIGLKVFLSGSAKDRIEQLKKINIKPEDFREIQEQIDSTIAKKAMVMDHARASTKQLADSKQERVQRMKEASDKLEKSDVLQTRAISAEKQKSQTALGDKEERLQRMKEAGEALTKSDALQSRAIRAESQKTKGAQLGDKEERSQRMKEAGEALTKSDALQSRVLRADKQKQQDALLGEKDERSQRMKEAGEALDNNPKFKEKLKKKDS